MKVSTFFLAALAGSASAFPHMAGQLTGRDQQDQSKALLAALGPLLVASQDGSIAKLNAALDEAVAEIAPHVIAPNVSFAAVPIKDITEESIYDAFGLKRDPVRTRRIVRETKNPGGLVWGNLGEDRDHRYKSPRKGDLRGPCPALNALANHNYLPRNGVVTPGQLVRACYEALSVSPLVAKTLALVGFVYKGDMKALTLSLGGKSGDGAGISSHGALEGDASITRQDSVLNGGDGWSLDRNRLNAFINDVYRVGHGNVNAEVMAETRHRVWSQSKNDNPEFDFNPLRMYTALGENAFVTEVLRGDSDCLTPKMLKSWFVDERIPKGWRRRYVPVTSAEIQAWQVATNRLNPVAPTGTFATLGGLDNLELWNSETATPGSIMCGVVGDLTALLPDAVKAGLQPFLAPFAGGCA